MGTDESASFIYYIRLLYFVLASSIHSLILSLTQQKSEKARSLSTEKITLVNQKCTRDNNFSTCVNQSGTRDNQNRTRVNIFLTRDNNPATRDNTKPQTNPKIGVLSEVVF